jgi:hypothetical protein
VPRRSPFPTLPRARGRSGTSHRALAGAGHYALRVPANWIWMQVAIIFFVIVAAVIAIVRLA